MIKISVVIPVYNAERYLAQCLDSVIHQTMREIEIICVDDGSTDASYEILQKYKMQDNRITVLQQKNEGAGIARNKGIAEATGEYIHFLDADDYMVSDAYEKLYSVAKKYHTDFVKAKAYTFDNAAGKVVANGYYELFVLQSDNYDRVYRFSDAPETFCKIAVVPWNGIYKREFLLEHQIIFNNLPCVNDRSFYTNVLIHAKRFSFLDEYIIYYRTNNSNSLIGNRGKNFYCHFESYKQVEQQCQDLSDYERAVVLNAELTDLFLWYKRLQKANQLSEATQVQLDAFAQNLDVSQIINQKIFCPWVDTYQELKGIAHKKSIFTRLLQQVSDKGIGNCVAYVRKYGILNLIEKIKERIL